MAKRSQRRDPGVAKYLNRNLALEVLPLSQIDDAHSAFAQHPQDPVRADSLETRWIRRTQNLFRNLAHIPVEQRAAASVLVDHRQHFRNQRAIVGAFRFEKRSLFRRREFHRVVEQTLDSIPPRAFHH